MINMEKSIKRKKNHFNYHFFITMFLICILLLVQKQKVYAYSPLDSSIEEIGNTSLFLNNTMNCAAINVIGPVVDGIKDTVVDSLTNYVADTTLNGMVGWVYDLYEQIATGLSKFVLEDLGPDIQYFADHAAGATAVFKSFPYIGGALAVTIYAIMMIMCLIGSMRAAEVKESPIQLTVTFVVIIIFLYFSEKIIDIVFNFMNKLYEYVVNFHSNSTELVAAALVPKNMVDAIWGEVSNVVLAPLLTLVFGFIFLKHLWRFICEIYERYMVACLLYYLFPVTLATAISKSTNPIFKKYFQMLISQLFLLIMNYGFLQGIISISGQTFVDNGSLTQWVFLITFMKVAERIDSYALTMGLSIPITGGKFMDSFSTALFGVSNMLRSATMGASFAGNAMQSAAMKSGDMGLMKKGLSVSSFGGRGSAGPSNNAKALEASGKGNGLEKMAKSIKVGGIDQSMIDLAKSGTHQAQLLNACNDDVKQELFNEAFGENSVPEGTKLSNITWDGRGGVDADFSYDTKDGIAEGKLHLDHGESGKGVAFTDADGFRAYASVDSRLDIGQTMSYSASGSSAQAMAEMLTGHDFGRIPDSIKESCGAVGIAENGNAMLYKGDGSDMDAIASIGKNGISYNPEEMQISAADLSRYDTFAGLDDLQLERLSDDSIRVTGTRTLSEGENGKTLGYEQYRLKNATVYGPSKEPKYRHMETIGINNATTGTWNVSRYTGKDTAEIQKNYESAKAAKYSTKKVNMPHVTRK